MNLKRAVNLAKEFARKLYHTEMSHGSARHARRTLLVSYAKIALKKVITKDIKCG